MAKFDAIKDLRNRIANEMLQFLISNGNDYPVQPFVDMVALLRKVEIWWFENFEMSIAPEDFPPDLKLDEVTPGRVLYLQLFDQYGLRASRRCS